MKALVTGGGGFLGSAIARALREREWQVTCLQRGDYPELEAAGCRCQRGDICDLQTVIKACTGQDIVFHVAAKAGVWGSWHSYFQPNVIGTRNIIAGCKRAAVPRLVYTSSPSVVFNGSDEAGIDESEPYPSHHLCHYSATKAMAEAAVLDAVDPHLACVALRPHLIWGAGDQHLLPRLVERARRGKLKFIGDGTNKIDATCIENAVAAHLQTADRLEHDAVCNGKAYFISNGEPLPSKELINKLLACAGEKPVDACVPAGVAYCAGALFEAVYGLLRIRSEPLMTRFVARQLSTEHWFDLSAARRDLDYQALINNETGFERLRQAMQSDE